MAKVSKDVEVKDTSVEYDTLIGFKETENRPGTLAEFLGMNDVPESEEEAWQEHNYQNWREHWKGMPAYESDNLEPKKQLIINFRSEEDFLKFTEVIGQKLTLKTRSVWHPEKLRDENSLKRWIEVDGEE